MTRRERLARIAGKFGDRAIVHAAGDILLRLTQGDVSDLSDEGLEKFVRRLVREFKSQQRTIRANRKFFAVRK